MGARLFVRVGYNARRNGRLRRWLLPVRRLSPVPPVAFVVGGVIFRDGRVLAFNGRMFAVAGGVLRRRGRRLATHVGAGRGGEHAAPTAQDESPCETKIYQLSRHGFFFS